MNFKFKILLLVFVVSFGTTNALAQKKNTDHKLADQYFSNKEYNKAVIYYQKIFDKTPTANYYNRLFSCFINLKEYKNAEKLVKRQIRKHAFELYYYTDLGYLYELAEQPSKSKNAYENAIKILTPNNQQIIELANGYLKYKKN